MKIAVYCGSGSGNRPEYAAAAASLGTWISSNGHALVYGGSNVGLMGTVADAVLTGGGKVIGVLPDIPLILSRKHPGITEVIKAPSIAERKTKMIELSDAFVALPGGVGTLDEITEILSLQSLGILDAPIVFVNASGYYEPMKAVIDNILQNEFGRSEYFSAVLFSDNIAEIGAFLETTSSVN